jgi:hypothetical protein
MADWGLEKARTWWLEFRKPRIGRSTHDAEHYRLKPMIRILRDVRLKQITNIALDNYVTKRLAEGIAPWSITKEVLTWSETVEERLIDLQPAADFMIGTAGATH